jgi:hypothetical protein
MLVEWISRTPELCSLPASHVRVVRGLRHWVAAHRLGGCPVAALRAQLGCTRTAAHLHLLLEEIGAAWPEPFAVSPPCCARLSHDESTLGQMLALAARQDRAGFDRLLGDLIGADERERLYHSAGVFGTILAA